LVEEEANVTRMMERGGKRRRRRKRRLDDDGEQIEGRGERKGHTEGKGRSGVRVLRGGGRWRCWRMERGEWTTL
jgi:hypothetical protein